MKLVPIKFLAVSALLCYPYNLDQHSVYAPYKFFNRIGGESLFLHLIKSNESNIIRCRLIVKFSCWGRELRRFSFWGIYWGIILIYINGRKGEPPQQSFFDRRRIYQGRSAWHPLLHEGGFRNDPGNSGSVDRSHGPDRHRGVRAGHIVAQLPLRVQVFGSGRRSGGDQGCTEGAFYERVLSLSPQLGHRVQSSQLFMIIAANLKYTISSLFISLNLTIDEPKSIYLRVILKLREM